MADGAQKLAEAVGSTLGPYGQNFALDGSGSVTNDGVTVAREFQLPDELENRGVSLLREAATKTVEEVGDGTSTAITLGYAIYDMASRKLSKENTIGMTPAEVVHRINYEKDIVIGKLQTMATPIKTKEELVKSAIVCTEDEELGNLIGEMQWDLGPNGYLIAEETADRKCSAERVSGIRIDNGYGTSLLINNQQRQVCEVGDVHILLTSITIREQTDFKPILEIVKKLHDSGVTKLVVVARAWTDAAIQFCLQNTVGWEQSGGQQGFRIYPFSAPYVDMQEKFKDMQSLLGGTFFDSESHDLKDITLSDLGFAVKVVGRRWDAIFTGKDDDAAKTRIEKRVQDLQERHDGEKSDFSKKELLGRIAQLQNGFGIIKVGSPSDTERKRLFDKAEDAVWAVRAALQEGTVAGAGLAFKEISEGLPDDFIIKRPLLAPYNQITSSAPKDFKIEPWVRDPVKVLRVALEKACAAASSFSTAGGVITEKFPSEINDLLTK